MARKVILVLVVFIVLVLVYAGLQNPDYVISRSIAINAPAEKIFPYLNSTTKAEAWGPWADIDPEVKMTNSGPAEGVGSRSDWTSPGQMGTGSATIVEVLPLEKVRMKLEYTEPMQMTQESEYLIETQGAQTLVTWKVQGQNGFIGRVMCLFVSMDKMVGTMFEKGLNKLKVIAETP